MTHPRSSTGSPPEPRGLPYFGCLGDLRRNAMAFFTRVAREVGGLARIPLPKGNSVYLVSEPGFIKELLIDHRPRFMKNVRYGALQRVLGEGLILSEGDTWRRQRMLTQPAFKRSELGRQVQWMSASVASFLKRWERYAERGESFDLELEALRLTQLLAGVLIVGPRFEDRAQEVFEITEDIKRNWPRPPRGILSGFLPRSRRKAENLEKAIVALEARVYEFIARQKQSPPDEGGILGLLISGAQQEGQPFTDLQLRDQVITLFFAAYETSAAAMCWTHYLLSQHPAVRARVLAEVDAVLGDRLPGSEDVARLPYVEQVLQESLRMYAPIHALSRVALQDATVGGYTIPKGCAAVVSLYATHRLPRYWPDPETFDPDRFTPEACAARDSFAYMPFAVGHRNCIGGTLAMVEGKLIVAQVAQRYELNLAPGHRVEPYGGTTMRPRYGMRVTAAKRTQRVTA